MRIVTVTKKHQSRSSAMSVQFFFVYGIRETRITGETDDVSVPTVKSWIERIPELVRGYEREDIWNMGELGLFFKFLLDKGLMEKAKSKKGGKKAKVRLRLAFFVNADGQKVD